MNHAAELAGVVGVAVRVVQRARDFGDEKQRDGDGHTFVALLAARAKLLGVLTVDEFENLKRRAVHHSIIEHAHDAAVVEARSDARLVEKHPHRSRVGVAREEPFDRNAPREPSVALCHGFEDLGHPSLAELATNHVTRRPRARHHRYDMRKRSAMGTLRLWTCLAMLGSAACGHAPIAKVPVTVVIRGDADERKVAERALVSSPPPDVEIRTTDVSAPAALGQEVTSIEPALAHVRAAYDEPNWQTCLAPLADPTLVSKLLGEYKREAASRVLFWRAACHLLKGDEANARSAASDLASLGLDIPNEKSDPAVPRLLDAAIDAQTRRPRTTMTIVSANTELSVSIDGHPNVCTTPCPIEVGEGKHALHVSGDGSVPEDREVDVSTGPLDVHFDLAVAAPELAAEQWVTRWASSAAIDGPQSLHLLTDATRARNLVLLVAQGGAKRNLRATLVVDGIVRARTEKEGAAATESPSLLRELLVSGHLVQTAPIYKNPFFWLSIAAALGAGIVGTYFLTTIPRYADVRLVP